MLNGYPKCCKSDHVNRFSIYYQVDVVAGPDAYRDLPRLLAVTHFANQPAINVILSLEVYSYNHLTRQIDYMYIFVSPMS